MAGSSTSQTITQQYDPVVVKMWFNHRNVCKQESTSNPLFISILLTTSIKFYQ